VAISRKVSPVFLLYISVDNFQITVVDESGMIKNQTGTHLLLLFVINLIAGLQQLSVLLIFQPFFSFPHTVFSLHPS
jgi:hypothetical protein